ncbi:MAG: hypothetical protein WAV15_02600 [Minisyncoccia bacterium]
MDNKSKTLIAIFILIVLVSVFFTYKRSFIDGNFTITEEVPEDEAVGGDEITEELPE